MISALVACVYVGLNAGAVIDANVDGHSQQRDTTYRAYVGEDFGDWRAELAVERLGSGISFDNILALAYGVSVYRDLDFGDYTLSLGVGADVLDAQAVQGLELGTEAQGSGVSLRAAASLEHEIRRDLFLTASVAYRDSDLEFSDPFTTFDKWHTTSLLIGLRREF